MLKKNIKKFPALYTLTALLALAGEFVMIIGGYLAKFIFGCFEERLYDYRIFLLIFFYFISSFSSSLFSQINTYFTTDLKLKLENNIRKWLLKEAFIPTKEFNEQACFDKFKYDCEDIGNFLSSLPLEIADIAAGLTAAAIVLIMYTKAAIVGLTVCSFVLCLILLFKKLLFTLEKRRKSAVYENFNKTSQIISCTYFIKASNCIEEILKDLERCESAKNKKIVAQNVLKFFLNTLSFNLIFIAVSFVLLFSYDDFVSGTFTVGDFAMVDFSFWTVNTVPSAISNTIEKYSRYKTSLKRLNLK
ncbi:MAG: hypothetical protein LBH37_04610 [Oscillospiraceae bacterium]|jgi:ABC-type bacteriocin/lantibiotic exporter with double-glycine peptidase domain|nr:hypothetical protein [Oscillospiraceae bacterium]